MHSAYFNCPLVRIISACNSRAIWSSPHPPPRHKTTQPWPKTFYTCSRSINTRASTETAPQPDQPLVFPFVVCVGFRIVVCVLCVTNARMWNDNFRTHTPTQHTRKKKNTLRTPVCRLLVAAAAVVVVVVCRRSSVSSRFRPFSARRAD